MRKIILSVAISFDGFIEGPNGEIDWIPFDQDAADGLAQFYEEVDTILYGRVSYEMWGNYTPPANSPDFEKENFKITSKMQKIVFSTSQSSFPGNPIVIQNNIRERVQELKQQPGKNIWLFGGNKLVTSLMNLQLVDEFRIAVIPIILGSGKPLFASLTNRTKLHLEKIVDSKSGVVQFNYQRIN